MEQEVHGVLKLTAWVIKRKEGVGFLFLERSLACMLLDPENFGAILAVFVTVVVSGREKCFLTAEYGRTRFILDAFLHSEVPSAKFDLICELDWVVVRPSNRFEGIRGVHIMSEALLQRIDSQLSAYHRLATGVLLSLL